MTYILAIKVFNTSPLPSFLYQYTRKETITLHYLVSFWFSFHFDFPHTPFFTGIGKEIRASQVALVAKNSPPKAGDIKDTGLIPGLRRSPGGEHGNPLQYSSLENPMDRGTWWPMVHSVTKSWTWLKRLSMHTHTHETSAREGQASDCEPKIILCGVGIETKTQFRQKMQPSLSMKRHISRLWSNPPKRVEERHDEMKSQEKFPEPSELCM